MILRAAVVSNLPPSPFHHHHQLIRRSAVHCLPRRRNLNSRLSKSGGTKDKRNRNVGDFEGFGSSEFDSGFSLAEVVDRDADDEFVVVNFYRFVLIKELEAEVAKHLEFVECTGPSKDALAYVNWLRHDPKFGSSTQACSKWT